jgi:hypothetical protein
LMAFLIGRWNKLCLFELVALLLCKMFQVAQFSGFIYLSFLLNFSWIFSFFFFNKK